jgi:hypothetical protein
MPLWGYSQLGRSIRLLFRFGLLFTHSPLARPAPRIGNISLDIPSADKRLPSKLQSPKTASAHQTPYCLPRYTTQTGSFRGTNPIAGPLSIKTC